MPAGVCTVTSTVPADSAGESAVHDVLDEQLTPVAAVEPKLTVSPNWKPVPVMVTVVPPAVGPAVGLMAVTVGGVTYVNWSAEDTALVPAGVVTVMSTKPAEPAGETAVTEVGDT